MHGINKAQNIRNKERALCSFLLPEEFFRIMIIAALCKVACDFLFFFVISYGIPQTQKSFVLFSAQLPYILAHCTMCSFKSSLCVHVRV